MLYGLIIFLLWYPALLGYGRVIHFFGFSDDNRTGFWQVLAGMAILASLTTILNFFFPIQRIIPFTALFIGWGLALPWLKKQTIPQIKTILFASILILIIITLRAWVEQSYYDTGLYHQPLLLWVRENPLPWGLANLHIRFGFNSAWNVLAAVFQIPFVHEPRGLFFINGFLAFAVAMHIWFGLQKTPNQQWDSSFIYLLLLPLTLMMPVLNTVSLANLNNDLPLFWISIFLAYELINLSLKKILPQPIFTLSVFFAVFATLIKLSGGILLFVPLFIFIKFRDQITLLKTIKTLSLPVLFLIIPWFIKNFLLSGCFIFPIVYTCIPTLPWSVPTEEAQRVTNIVLTLARAQTYDINEVQGFGWVPAWFARHTRSIEFKTMLVLFVISPLFLWFSQWKKKQLNSLNWFFQIPFLICIAYWYLSAPDMRFGSGYIFTVIFFSLASGLSLFLEESNKTSRLIRFSLFSLITALSVVGLIRLTVGSDLARMPNLGYPPTAPKVSLTITPLINGQVVYQPTEDWLCWDAPLPCTTEAEFNPNLTYTQTKSGYFSQFEIATP